MNATTDSIKISFFSAQPYDKEFFVEANKNFGFQLEFSETHLGPHIVNTVENTQVVCVFVNDKVTPEVIKVLAAKGVKIIALRCAGFNNISIAACKEVGIKVCRVPAYSPEAVAEHAVALILTLNRKTNKAYNRVREQNFSLNGLLGFNLHNKIIGVIGTGNIGQAFCKIMLGFGCQVMAFDLIANKDLEALGVTYHPLISLLQNADIISLHCPLNEQTKHLINSTTIAMMKKGVMIINTSRGALIDTRAVIEGLKKAQIGYLGIDVYEQEEKLFFKDLSSDIIQDDVILRLMSFQNVLITAHQAFFTKEALSEIAHITLTNVLELSTEKPLSNKAALLA
jgi:D-lactate dehydrogenase